MEFTEDKINAQYVISSWTSETMVINQKSYHQSLIVSPQILITDWPVSSLEQLDTEHVTTILSAKPDIVILGCGNNHPNQRASLLKYFHSSQTGVEMMSTAAACRTYNILAAENRNVVAALIIE